MTPPKPAPVEADKNPTQDTSGLNDGASQFRSIPQQETGIGEVNILLKGVENNLQKNKGLKFTPTEAAQALLRLIEEKVIGVDEPRVTDPKSQFSQHRIEVRNNLRAEQRSKLRELLGNNDG